MSAKNKAVFGIYTSQLDAENAVHGLKLAGFRSTDISILFPDNTGTKDLALERNTKAPEGTAAGAGSGAVVGGVLGWLAGVGLLAIPGLGMFVAAGPILAMLSGIGVGGVLGGVTGALVGLGTPEYEAKRYEGRIRKGGILLSVHCDDREWVKTAREILVQTGAEDVSSTTEAKADFAASDRPRSRTIPSKA
ncbi:MAG: general stress protein [Bryobacteraceae bacterium]